jgi:hypothetical protein
MSCLSLSRGCIPRCQEALSVYSSETDGTTYNVTYEDIQTADVSCQNIQEKYVTEACSIAECCPGCIDELEAIMSCVVNQVVAEVVPSLQGEVCDTSCTSRRNVRLLQINDGTVAQGFNPASESNGFEVPSVLDKCRRQLIEQVVFGDAANAAQQYTACLQGRMMAVWDAIGGVNETSAGKDTEYSLLGLIPMAIYVLTVISFLQ